ncbi:Serine/threonine-protein kinase PrkC [Anaerohalosphaera lusitana]|uniref:Serine/threonine-protein kinase PrkC n=1 Tax=Anaerohalosphaera lusitana TaxID=1936003 RepID=A0A1U9NQN0_9BACT|nr:DNRLRE domain-containing protein [Anaerohalosphaera lusitana]AQT70044.1 Serine/threonine-protein kinase PrkC [Anaerohalosphaera lusitana]
MLVSGNAKSCLEKSAVFVKKQSKCIFAIIVMAFSVGMASEVSLDAGEDACVYSGSSQSNYGENNALIVGQYSGEWRFYVKWDISTLSQMEVNSAKIRLRKPMTGSALSILFGKATSDWSQQSLTWDNKPTATTLTFTQYSVSGDLIGWLDFEIPELKSYLQTAIDNGQSDISLCIQAVNPSGYQTYESLEAGNAPRLVADCAPANSSDIQLTIQDQNATPKSNVKVVRYWNNDQNTDERITDTSGQVLWQDVSAEYYAFEAYYEGQNPFDNLGELWCTGELMVDSASHSIVMKRNWPFVKELNLYRVEDDQLLNSSSTVIAGEELRIEAVVVNNTPTPKKTRIRLLLDRDQSTSWDFDVTTPYHEIAGNSQYIFSSTFTPNEEGNYYKAVRTEVDPGGKTDAWDWADSFHVKPSVLHAVPYYSQYNAQWCLFHATTMAAKYYGSSVTPWELAAWDGEDVSGGGSISDITETIGVEDVLSPLGEYFYARDGFGYEHKNFTQNDDSGLSDYMLWQSVRNYLDQTVPLGPLVMGIVPSDEVANAGHAVVLTGISNEGVYVHDPSGALFSFIETIDGTYDKPEVYKNVFVKWEKFKALVHDTPYPILTLRFVSQPSPISRTVSIQPLPYNDLWEEMFVSSEAMNMILACDATDPTEVLACFDFDGSQYSSGYGVWRKNERNLPNSFSKIADMGATVHNNTGENLSVNVYITIVGDGISRRIDNDETTTLHAYETQDVGVEEVAPFLGLAAGDYQLKFEVVEGAVYRDVFALDFHLYESYDVVPESDENGSILPSEVQHVEAEQSKLFTALPDSGYTVDQWYVDDVIQSAYAGVAEFTLENVTSDHIVRVTYKPITVPIYTLTAQALAGGTVSPRNAHVEQGQNQTFSAVPSEGYRVSQWFIDDVHQSTIDGQDQCTITNVQSDHQIVVDFELVTVTVPDVVGCSEAEAESILANSQLTLGSISHDYSETVPVGFVISQLPASGSFTTIGESVDLIISDGPSPDYVDIVVEVDLTTTEKLTGGNLEIPVTISNTGTVNAVPNDPYYFDTTAYIETDQQVDWNSLGETSAVAELEMSSLAAGSDHVGKLTFVAPQQAGTYYVRIKGDDFDSVEESDETNNWSSIITLNILEPLDVADITGDGSVNFKDFAKLAGNWLNSCDSLTYCDGADVNRDKHIDILDLIVLSEFWLEQIEPTPVNGFIVTEGLYDDQAEWDAIVCEQFGADYRVADWNDLKQFYADGGDLLALFDGLGLTEHGDCAFVTRGGVKQYSSDRYYYASRHEHSKPSYYMAHDNIDNYLVSLGSWYGSRRILAIKEPTLFFDNFNDGDFVSDPQWQEQNNDDYPGSVVVEDGALKFYRSGAGGNGGSVGVLKEASIPVNSGTYVAFDANAVYRSVGAGCGWNCGEFPVIVQLTAQDSDGNEMILKYALNYGGAIQDKTESTFIQRCLDVPQGEWVQGIAFNIQETWPEAASIISIQLRGAGWDFEGYIDNFQIGRLD